MCVEMHGIFSYIINLSLSITAKDILSSQRLDGLSIYSA